MSVCPWTGFLQCDSVTTVQEAVTHLYRCVADYRELM